jgi:hypothetical protein
MIGTALSPPDPDWLLSTAAQSAAALVAIIGGLLVSRLVALSVERESLQRQRDETETTRDLAQQRLSVLTADIAAMDQSIFRERVMHDYVIYHGYPPDETLFPPTTDEEAVWGEELSVEVEKAFTDVVNLLTNNDKSITLEGLAHRGLDLRLYTEDLLKEVVWMVNDERRPVTTIAYNMPLQNLSTASVGQASMVAGRDRLERDLHVQEALLALQDKHLNRLATPRGVGWGIWSLVVFSLLGIVLPLSLMVVHPVPDDTLTRVGIISAFVLGLGCVLLFIRWQWRLLTVNRRSVGEP